MRPYVAEALERLRIVDKIETAYSGNALSVTGVPKREDSEDP